jgi:hypothetical protein
MVPQEMPTEAARYRIGRDRGRVRELLQRHGRQGDDRRNARPHPAGGGRDVSAFVHKALTKQGMKIHVSSGVDKLEATASGVRATLKGGAVEEFSHAIIAIGIVPNTENIGLEALGIKTNAGISRRTATGAPMSRASTRSATSPARPGSRTRRATKA